MNVQEECPLSGDNGKIFHKEIYFRCDTCKGIFRSRSSMPDSITEKERYEAHDNDVDDRQHQNFVAPITKAVKTSFRRNTSSKRCLKKLDSWTSRPTETYTALPTTKTPKD